MGMLSTFAFVDDPSVTIDTIKLSIAAPSFRCNHLRSHTTPITEFASVCCGISKLMAYLTYDAFQKYDEIARCVSKPVVLYFMYEEMWPFKAQLANGRVRFFYCDDDEQWRNKMRLRLSKQKAIEKKIETLYVEGAEMVINVNRFRNAVKKNQIVWTEVPRSLLMI